MKKITLKYSDFPKLEILSNSAEDQVRELLNEGNKVTLTSCSKYLKIPESTVNGVLRRLEKNQEIKSEQAMVKDKLGRRCRMRVYYK